MYYLIGRDLDADGQYEFIKDMDNMILTEDANHALQVTEAQLDYIDMEYLNEAGFYAMEADRFKVSILEQLLFSPLVMGYRPRAALPPRRRRRMPPPPPRRVLRRTAPPRPHAVTVMDVLGAMLAPEPAPRRRAPRPRPAAPRPRAAAPRPRVVAPRPAAAPARPAAGRSPARPAAGRTTARPVLTRPAGRGPAAGRKPGGRGPGR